MKKFLRSCLAANALVLGSAALVPHPAGATVVIQPSLESMTQKSQVVVHAVVEEQTVTLAEESKRILTLTRLRVKEGVKGGAKQGDTITIYQVGGTWQGRVARVIGMSDFKVGEEVILFGATFLATDTVKFLQDHRAAEVPAATLHPTAGWVVTYGVGLGKYRVDRSGQTPMAIEELGDVATMRRVGNDSVITAPAARTQQPLGVFLEEVRRLSAERRTP